MSAFMVSDDCMTRILRGIAIMNSRGAKIAEVILPGNKFPIEQRQAALTELGKKLFDMNAAAVDTRYGRDEHKTFRAPWDNYRFTGHIPSTNVIYEIPIGPLCETYKAISCYLYQCSEGDVDESPTYKTINGINRDLAELIVSKLPAFNNAPWD